MAKKLNLSRRKFLGSMAGLAAGSAAIGGEDSQTPARSAGARSRLRIQVRHGMFHPVESL